MNPDRSRRPAMADVARLADVSHQTVSRVINGHPSVRPETRQRVRAAIAELGYRQNNVARALATNRSQVLGLLTPATSLYGPTSALVAIEQAAMLDGWHASVAALPVFDAVSVSAATDRFLSQGVDGIVVIAPTTAAIEAIAAIDAAVPVVVATSANLPGAHRLHTVGVDQRQGAALAVEHLAGRGHEEIIHVAGPQEWYDAHDRMAGYRSACEASGIRMNRSPITGWSAADGYGVGRAMMTSGPPSAVFAANDQIALGLLHAFSEAGAHVPGDVAIVGFDDEPGAAHYLPPLTTVRQGFDALGRLAVASMTAALDGSDPGPQRIPAELIVRSSS